MEILLNTQDYNLYNQLIDILRHSSSKSWSFKSFSTNAFSDFLWVYFYFGQ